MFKISRILMQIFLNMHWTMKMTYYKIAIVEELVYTFSLFEKNTNFGPRLALGN